MDVLRDAEVWLRCVDEYDKKGNLIRQRKDPQTNLIRRLAEEVESGRRAIPASGDAGPASHPTKN